jgi:opacity protein-like surface antigen
LCNLFICFINVEKDIGGKRFMNKVFALLTAAIAMMMPIASEATEGSFYGGVQGGVNLLHCSFLESRNIEFNTGYTVAGVAGYFWHYGLRLEGEVAYRDNDYRLFGTNSNAVKTTFHGHVDTWSFMANGYYDIPFCDYVPLNPYFGAGIGDDFVHQRINMEGTTFRGNKNGFSWQVMAGLNYTCFESFMLSLEYKFHMAPLRYGNHLQNNSVILGIKKFFCF